MVESIYAIKNRIIEHIISESADLDRANVKELGEFVDMVKDLAEAEKNCWEASYYKGVSEAMDASGYDGMPARSGYDGASRPGYGGMRSGYGDDFLEQLGKEYRELGPDERMAMRKKVFSTLGIK